jgi:ubiquinone/menaquinone biosynthesis C-methylase UbiE
LREYKHFDYFLNILMTDIYPQPPDDQHSNAIEDVCTKWLPDIAGIETILDVGCGQGQAMEILARYGKVTGVTLGSDADFCQANGLDVRREDMSFLSFDDEAFDLIFARHTLEHSPMPLITLMEWRRVSKQYLLLVLPTLAHYGPGGQTHYYVLSPAQWLNLLDNAGWKIIWVDSSREQKVPFEHRYLCEKAERKRG